MRVSVKTKKGVERFRRAGLRFTQEPQNFDVSKEQLKVLKAEPMLVVGKPMQNAPDAPSDDEDQPASEGHAPEESEDQPKDKRGGKEKAHREGAAAE